MMMTQIHKALNCHSYEELVSVAFHTLGRMLALDFQVYANVFVLADQG